MVVEFLHQQIGNNSILEYLSVLFAAGTIGTIVALIRYLVVRRLTRLALQSETIVDDVVVRLIQRIMPWLIAVIVLALGLRALDLPPKLSRGLALTALAAAFFQVGCWGETLLRVLITRSVALSGQTSADNSPARRAVLFVGRWLLWSLILVLLLENAGVDLSALLAGLGIGGIAVALAVQNILGDLFCFAAIVFDKPFEQGDFLVVGEQRGTVEKIGIRTTRVRSLDGEQLVFANNDLVSSRIRNFKRMQERRVVFQLGVIYETAPEKLRRIPQLIASIINEIPGTRFDRAHFAGFGDFSLNFEIVYYVLDSDYNRYMDIQQTINLALCERLALDGIEFAYPSQTVFVRNQANISSEVAHSLQGGR